MRHLILMRHAEAGMPPLGEPDKQRPLTMRGQQDAVNQAISLLKQTIIPDKTLCSNAKRTSSTWDMVHSQLNEHLPCDFTMEKNGDLYNASYQKLFDHITTTQENIDVLMVVAHNPGIHEAAQALAMPIKGSAHSPLSIDLQMGFPPASMAVFEIDSIGWHDLSHQTATLKHFFKV